MTDTSTPPPSSSDARDAIQAVRAEVGKVIVGQDGVIAGILTSMLVGGHVLLEGVPGVAKSLTVSTLAAALGAADFVDALKGDGPFTVFAPTDEAFDKLPEGTVETLLRPENRDRLIEILTYHVVPGRVTAEQVVRLEAAETLAGVDVRIDARGGEVRINGVHVIQTDVFASNGVIHVIDEVLLPPERSTEPEARMSTRSDDRARTAAELLVLAIDRGVPLFNDGSTRATADLYEVTVRAVLAGDFGLPTRARRALEQGIREGRPDRDSRERAWTYRDAMDRALSEIEGRMTRRRAGH